MNEMTAILFDEFATAYRRGDAPDVLAYLERAGDDVDALADLIDRFLQAVPAREPTEEEIVLAQARLEQEPPLLVLRLRRAITRDAVVDALVRVLGLDPAKRDKIGGYYHRLEVGTLDPKGVDGGVWSVLADLLKANVRALAEPPPPAVSGISYMREATQSASYLASWHEGPGAAAPSPEKPEPPQREPDEIDRLFTGSD